MSCAHVNNKANPDPENEKNILNKPEKKGSLSLLIYAGIQKTSRLVSALLLLKKQTYDQTMVNI